MLTPLLLTHKGSNLERQNQNLLCYHYTMGQSSQLVFPFDDANIELKILTSKFRSQKFIIFLPLQFTLLYK